MTRRFAFDDWEFDADLGTLANAAGSHQLQPQVARLLEFLLQHPSALLGRDELLREVWGGRVVSDDAIHRCVSLLRQVLSPGDRNRYLRTVSKKGYATCFPEVRALDAVAPRGGATPVAGPGAAAGSPGTADAIGPGAEAAPAGGVAVSAPLYASIAVLPFADRTATRDHDWFCDGLAEEILTALTRLERLRVIARTSSFAFRGSERTVAEIAAVLRVDAVLEGSVRRAGDRLRIAVRMIRTADSAQVWAEGWERGVEDIFGVQDEIAEAVATQLDRRLVQGFTRTRPADPEAWALYLRARHAARQLTPDGLMRATALYGQALQADPRNTDALAGLAENCVNQVYFGMRLPQEGFREAREASERALAIDPHHAGAHALLGTVAWACDIDLANAARLFRHALALDPGNLDILVAAVFVMQSLDRPGQAIAIARYVLARDPVNAIAQFQLGYSLFTARRYREAIAANRAALGLNPGFMGVRTNTCTALIAVGEPEEALATALEEPSEMMRLIALVQAYHALGRRAESDAALALLIERYEEATAHNIACVLAFRGEADRAFAYLEKSVALHNTQLSYAAVDPMFENLHADPRWAAFLRRLRVTPEQLAAIPFEVILPGQ